MSYHPKELFPIPYDIEIGIVSILETTSSDSELEAAEEEQGRHIPIPWRKSPFFHFLCGKVIATYDRASSTVHREWASVVQQLVDCSFGSYSDAEESFFLVITNYPSIIHCA